MRNETRNDKDQDMMNVWRNQPVERIEISLGEIRRKSRKLQKRVLWRNLREYAAGIIVIAAFGFYIPVFHTALISTGCGMIIAATLFVAYMLHKRGAARNTPTEAGFSTCVDFHRKELERQRDLMQSVWSWYLLPFVPGMIVFLCGLFVFTIAQPNAPAHLGTIVLTFALMTAGIAIVLVGIGILNQRAAGKLQREIDTLDGLEKES
jgi:hypothetical protein